MNLILDTNIFISNPTLSSMNWDVLNDYLLKTDSKIIMPQIINKEISAVYKRRLQKEYSRYKSSMKSVNDMILESIKDNGVNIEEQADKIKTHIFQKLNIKDSQIIEHKPDYLDKAIYRAVNHIRPCSDKKEEFRDTIIWLTLIDMAKMSSEKIMAFITNNTKDFYREDKLHPDLQRDLEENGIKILLFTSLSDFIKDHSNKIERYSIEQLVNKVNLEKLNEEIFDEIVRDINTIKREIERQEYEVYDYTELIQCDFRFQDVAVYEMQEDDHYFVQAELYDEIEVEAEVEKIDPIFFVEKEGVQTKMFYFEMRAVVNIIFCGEKVIRQQINFVEPY